MHSILLSASTSMNEFSGSDIFVVCFVALVFGLGIYTLYKFSKSKDF